ncbi:unnamed protein product [Durusdinium trenchii]|uniref:Uncharacterized protein n=1 Tax=Durusdinium trenchii TaxID=1381693 RepID=A0ABP0IQR6_9DINO
MSSEENAKEVPKEVTTGFIVRRQVRDSESRSREKTICLGNSKWLPFQSSPTMIQRSTPCRWRRITSLPSSRPRRLRVEGAVRTVMVLRASMVGSGSCTVPRQT